MNIESENKRLEIEVEFEAPVKKVWQAITVRDFIKEWCLDLIEFKAEKGFQFSFIGGPTLDRQYVHLCEVVEVVHQKRLSLNLQYAGYSGVSLVTLELFELDGKTHLRLLHSGIDTFPEENADLSDRNFQEGWIQLIGGFLKGFLEK